MNEQLQVGDVVQLKSGGPKMTVVEVTPGDSRIPEQSYCTWFEQDGAGKQESAGFVSAALRKVDPPSGKGVIAKTMRG